MRCPQKDDLETLEKSSAAVSPASSSGMPGGSRWRLLFPKNKTKKKKKKKEKMIKGRMLIWTLNDATRNIFSFYFFQAR
jgi:hypothetical protein